MRAKKHYTCNYQMNVATLSAWLSNNTLAHGMTRKSQNLQMCCCDQYNEAK